MFQVVLLAVCIVVSAFFSASEAAFLSVRRGRMRHMAAAGVGGADRVAAMAERPERFLPTVLLGNNLVNTGAAALGTAMALALLDQQGVAVLASTVGVALLLLVFGETLPKTIATRHPERLAMLFAVPLRWIEWVLFPVAAVLQRLSRVVADRVVGVGSPRTQVTEEEIRAMISLGREAGSVERAEEEMLHKVFSFGDRQVREIMTPRTEIVWVEKGTTLDRFLELYNEHLHTRFPVFEEDVDNVVGILSAKDVLRMMATGWPDRQAPVTTLVRPAYFVPETKLVSQLFAEIREQGRGVVMVVDEFGGIAGLVTAKQLVQQVVGRFEEEGKEELEYLALDEHTFQVDGGMRVSEANEQMGLDLPEGDYETVAGFVLERLGRIPQEGDHMHHGGVRLVVSKMQGVKVQTITVTRLAPPRERAAQ
ncbi:MAG: HlyC/CorC family transporter [Chloroflexi bacterium]|nr:HlyC/CorC family transporter [Chloroflexota bacterium]